MKAKALADTARPMNPLNGVPLEVAQSLADPDFTSREWVHQALDRWARSEDRGLYLVGGPGTGKSLLIADLIRRHIDASGGKAAVALVGWHFCRAANDKTILPEHVIGSLAAQLSALPGYLDALTTVEPKVAAIINGAITVQGNVEAGAVITAVKVTLLDASPQRQFDQIIRTPLANMASKGVLQNRLVLAIDGLDEALAITDGELLVGLLSRLTSPDGDLPPGVKLLLSGRPDKRITSRLRVPILDIGSDKRSDEDIRAYALQRLGAVLDPAPAARLAGRLSAAADGIFLYARYVLDDLLSDPAKLVKSDPRLLSLPRDLADYYTKALNRELTSLSEQWEERYRPLLGALAVARGSGFTTSELADITGLLQSRVDDALKRLSPYLAEGPGGRHQIFHQSFGDYIRAAGEHTVYPAEAHAAVAAYLATIGGERAQRDLIWHLAGAGDVPAIERRLTAYHLADVENRFGGPAAVGDLQLAAEAAASAGDMLRTLRWAWASVAWRHHVVESEPAASTRRCESRPHCTETTFMTA